MRGTVIDKIRRRLGLSHDEFARLLGIALSTSYRWAASRGELKMDPFHTKLLGYIQREVLRWAAPKRDEVIARIRRALESDPKDGTLMALSALLGGLFRQQ